MRNFLKSIYFKYIILTVISFLIVIIYHSINNSWTLIDGNCNGFFIAGATMILFGALDVCVNFGALDIFSYMFVNHKKEENKTFYDYCETKKEKRKKTRLSFLPYIIVGGVFIIVSIILLIIFNNTIR